MCIKKLYYLGKCVMTVDMDYIEDDIMYEYLNEIVDMFSDKAIEKIDFFEKNEYEARKVWKGNEKLYELMNQIEQELETEGLEMFEKVEQLYNIMQEKLNDEEFKLFGKLRGEYIRIWNKLDQDFFDKGEILNYVWVESNGKKYRTFLW